MKLPTTNPFLSQIIALAALIVAPLAHAADGTWNGVTGNWTDAGTWSGAIADGADSTAFFTGVDIAADRIITLNGNRTIGNITFTDATTSSNNLTITGNTLTLDRTTGVPSIDVTQAARGLTIESVIAGSDGLEKIGSGTLTLKGTNSFTGGLIIKAGTVTSNGAGGGGNFLSSGTVTIGDIANTGAAATLNFNGSNFTSTNTISVVGNGTSTISVTGWSQTLNGAITLSNNLNAITNNAFGSSMTFGGTGSIGGTGNLVIQSNAVNNANTSSNITFSGSGGINMVGSITNSGAGSSSGSGNINTTISAVIGTNVTGITQNSANSALILSGANTFTSNILISAGTLQANLTATGANPTSSALGNTQTAGRTVTISSGGTLNFMLTDVMGNGGSAPQLTLIANGGTIRNAGNVFNVLGPVQLNGGALSSFGGAAAAFPSFALTGTVTIGGSAVSTISNSGSNAQIGLQNGGTTFDVADAVSGSGSDLNVTGVLAGWNSGTGFLIKTGAGTMTLSNVNTFTGGTRIDNGTITLGHATDTLANGGAVNVNGGTLDLGTNTDTVGAVTLTSGSITGTGTLTGTGSAYDIRSGTVSAKLGGTVGLTKSTGGTVTLSGANTYSGATTISAGTLLVNGTHLITTAGADYAVSNSGSTLGGTGRIAVNGSVSVASTAILSPGASIGTLTLDGVNKAGNVLSMAAGSKFGFELDGSGGTPDQLAFWNYLSGDLTLNSNTIDLSLLGTQAAGTYNVDIFRFFSNAGTTATTHAFSSGLTIGTLGTGISAATIDWNGTGDNSQTIALNYTVIPEPHAALLGGLGLLSLLRRRRS